MVTTRPRRAAAAKRYREIESVPIGSPVRQHFEGYGWFNGQVKSYDARNELYKVRFEDGQHLQYDYEELKEILIPTKASKSVVIIENTSETESIPIGSSVRKHFEGHGWFNGKVKFYDDEKQLYGVEYSDGDHEQYNLKEIKEILIPTEASNVAEPINMETNESIPIGASVRKHFEGHGWFKGKVKYYNAKKLVYGVEYTDGDQEQYNLEELKKILIPTEPASDRCEAINQPTKVVKEETPTTKRRASPRSAVANTPPSTQSIDTPATRRSTRRAYVVTPSPTPSLQIPTTTPSLRNSTRKRGNLAPETPSARLGKDADDVLSKPIESSSRKTEAVDIAEAEDFEDNLPIAQFVQAKRAESQERSESPQAPIKGQKEKKEGAVKRTRLTEPRKTLLQDRALDEQATKDEGGTGSAEQQASMILTPRKAGNPATLTPATSISPRTVAKKTTPASSRNSKKKILDEDDDFLPDDVSMGEDDEQFLPDRDSDEELLSTSELSIAPSRTPQKKKTTKVVVDTVTDESVPDEDAFIDDDETAKKKAKVKKTKAAPKGGARQATKKSADTPTKKSVSVSGRRIDIWGLPRGALAKCPRSGFTIRALDSIPAKSESTRSNLLFGRLLVVATDDQGICPLEFVDKVFESAEALHIAIAEFNEKIRGTSPKIQFVTYEMEALSDPSFASWEFAVARLTSTGLIDANEKVPVLQIQIDWDGGSTVSAHVHYWKKGSNSDDNLLWAFLEGDQLKAVPPVLLGAPRALVDAFNYHDMANLKLDDFIIQQGCDESDPIKLDHDIVPQPINKNASRIKLAASLLEKSIRRGKKLCSVTPLLEASTELIHPAKACPGSTFLFLKALWSCMLVDVSPFARSHDCLGLCEILVLSLIARADPKWVLPPKLRRCVMASALRAFQWDKTQQWIGFVEPIDNWCTLEDESRAIGAANIEMAPAQKRAIHLRNILRVTQAVAGGSIKWGRWNKFMGDPSAAAVLSYLNHRSWNGSDLREAPVVDPKESLYLDNWERGPSMTAGLEAANESLDEECRMAAIEPNVMPQTLVLLQAVLECPPRSWKKHGLPSLSRQVRKLISDANPRYRERMQLARLQTWGKDKAVTTDTPQARAQLKQKTYQSFREVVTPTGTLSEGENDLVDCFESIQAWQLNRLRGNQIAAPSLTVTKSAANCHIIAGPPLSESDGRVGFILAFGGACEVKVNGEVVSAMFCGTADEPLLVQRIGKARKEGRELATAGGSTSGATAVPSLGYVQRSRSEEEAKLMEAAEQAVSAHWKGGKNAQLPVPPAGFQWDIPGTSKVLLGWDQQEEKARRTAELCFDSKGVKYWQFSIGGTRVEPFDARPVISACALDLHDKEHPPTALEPGSHLDCSLRTALYVQSNNNGADVQPQPLPRGGSVLSAMSELHNFAVTQRSIAPNEGLVYDWMPLAHSSLLPARVWRDALLAIRTRDSDHVVLGKGILSDGTGAPRDMTEGVLVRIFHALEGLYPMALRKEGALRFRIRPRGAAYHHLLKALEKLGRGEAVVKLSPLAPNGAGAFTFGTKTTSEEAQLKRPLPVEPTTTKDKMEISTIPQRRTRRQAALTASQKFSTQSMAEVSATDSKKDDDFSPPSDMQELGDVMDHELERAGLDEEATEVAFKGIDLLPLPEVRTKLWAHQELSTQTVVKGVKAGKRGHADASAVGAGKTLTALATIVRLAHWIQTSGQVRHGVLVMLPTKALIREWLLEIATHTKGFHVIEQREDGSLFSLTYGKTNPPIDGNALIITTLDRVCNHPFVRSMAWDFVVIDECLSVQNADAKRVPSAWRQIEVSTCGVLMLSATFFRSKYDSLFYMIRMLRSPLPRTMEWLPATIHEHIVCQIPETGRNWKMAGEMASLKAEDLVRYRNIIEKFQRTQINDKSKADGRKLWVELESFLRTQYEGRTPRTTSYGSKSVMGDAFAKIAKSVLRKRRRPLIFADTEPEAEFLLGALRSSGLDALMWKTIATKNIMGIPSSKSNKTVIVAVKSTEGQGINMQKHADTIICRPTPGDHLEQMKGRIDRPGQEAKELHLHVVVCEHSIEEAKFSNIRLAGNFFREYIAPVAVRYREKIDLEATLAAGGKGKLKRGTVSGAWKRSLDAAGQSGSFASVELAPPAKEEEEPASQDNWNDEVLDELPTQGKGKPEPKYKALNKVIRNKGDPAAVREAKQKAKEGGVSHSVYSWLFVRTRQGAQVKKKQLAKESPLRWSNQKPAVVLDPETIREAVVHLSKNDEKLAALISRVGADALIRDCGRPRPPTQERLFDRCVRAITFTMVSVDAGNAFLRRLAIKIGVCLESIDAARRKKTLAKYRADLQESGDFASVGNADELLQKLLQGAHQEIKFTPDLVGELVEHCEILNGKRSGYPHLCGVTFPCGKNDDPEVFLEKARAHAKGGENPVSAGFSKAKAEFIVSLINDFKKGKISGEKIIKASDREAAKMLMDLKGIGEWCAAQILMHFCSRSDVLMYGDLTVRNYLNDLYNINHQDSSETLLESAADFGDNATNRNLIDAVAKKNGWAPYRSVVCYLMYHLQEENLVLL